MLHWNFMTGKDFFEARKGCCGTVLLEASILCNQKSIRNSSGNIRSLSSTTLFPQSIRTSTPKSQSHRVSSAPASFDMKESLLRNNNGTNFDVGNGINRNMVKGREEDERQYSAKLSEVDIYESSRYDALLLKEDLKNTNWLHSGDDKCDQGPIFDNGFEHLPEPFGLL
ncbi:flocculation protein [Sesbania bispinosa]|nr:flocculation protein [Sesbania bispinosa]